MSIHNWFTSAFTQLQQDTETSFPLRGRLVFFLSIGYADQRASVIPFRSASWKAAKRDIEAYLTSSMADKPVSIKVDVVTNVEPIDGAAFLTLLTKTKKNYMRRGISFDADFHHAFMEQEVLGNAFIRFSKHHNRAYIAEQNVHHYINKHRPETKPLDFQNVHAVYLFDTQGVFCDEHGPVTLLTGAYDNGRRNERLTEKSVEQLVQTGQQKLCEMLQESGEFQYGMFAPFSTPINHYNMLRHASSLYALAESCEVHRDPEALNAVKRGLDFLLQERTVSHPHGLFVRDGTNPDTYEYKLGTNAAAVLALTKYVEVAGIKGNDGYVEAAQKLAMAMEFFQLPDGSFQHVFEHETFELKEAFRIVYYEGEAAFAWMRLYQLDQDDRWLNNVRSAFDHFIANDYWKHHDHWLSYCTNELVKIVPDRGYLKFGLQNAAGKLDFMYERKTTYPTFLELLLATNELIQRVKESEHPDLLEQIDEDAVIQTIHHRADYQRNGYFYPEIAMYMKHPDTLTGGFFIRHHSFRMRIDDIEHYISGYCGYINILKRAGVVIS
ncbi:hypothetical protein ACFO4L_09625 [Bacillus daqingensis]|uniref:Uncharacterized protein n=1 Tax=Bacillus daqingensis TaxID=872396 RepID=A0ABV9NTX2_9BACI